MRRVVISTIGTSLLTNQINHSNPEEKDWYNLLRDSANLTLEHTPKEVKLIIEALKNRAIEKLNQSSIKQIRSASAELNGIYGLYEENLAQGYQDMHWLICTDTAQGEETAKIVEKFIQKQGLTVQYYQPPGLSTANTQTFAQGIDELLTKLPQMTEGYDRVCFNLVGGFKSLQGYLNTIGMFYADEIIYIFESEKSELIKIPRLPIKIDPSVIEPYKVQFALMAAGGGIKRSDLANVQETLIYSDDDEVILSNWGKLIWEQAKKSILSQYLLTFPRLSYQNSFIKDYSNITDTNERVKLQETLAKLSNLLEKYNGNRSVLTGDGGVQLETYKNTTIDHFRVSLSMRVSCKALEGGDLSLRYYGTHDHVERSEKI